MNLAILHARRDELEAQMRQIHAAAGDRALNPSEQGKWSRLEAELREVRSDLDAAAEKAEREANVAAHRARTGSLQVGDGRDDTRRRGSELRGQAKRILDGCRHLSAEQGDRVFNLIDSDDRNVNGEWIARATVLSESPAYRSAFARVLLDPHPVLTGEEAQALRAFQEFRAASLTDAAGGYGVPVSLDSSIILTDQQSGNPVREISHRVTITSDVWKGVASDGVTWSWDAEASVVSDDAPTLTQPTITPAGARGFIPYSIEIGMDYPSFAEEFTRLLAEGFDELLAEAFITGSGSGAPEGILHALEANTNVQVAVTTAGTFTAADVDLVWTALPDRGKARATWLMSSDVESYIAAWSDAWGTRTSDLAGVPTTLRGRPMVTSSYMDGFTGATSGETIAIVGDFSKYYTVFRAGLTVEPIPHLFDVTTSMPTGQRGIFAFGRVGAGSVDDTAFRALVAAVG